MSKRHALLWLLVLALVLALICVATAACDGGGGGSTGGGATNTPTAKFVGGTVQPMLPATPAASLPG